jgi:hypothetical protein
VAMGAAELTGTVRDVDNKLVPGAVVALVPDEERRQGMGGYRGTQSDQNGRFELRDLVPGRYKVFAWEVLDPEVPLDREFRWHFESKAMAVTLAENGRETVELKAIPTEEVARVLW